jgi:hypothetical protein
LARLETDFDLGLYHFDSARNVLDPKFEQVVLIPMGKHIPHEAFESLLHALAQHD